jgi:hypothetical protein
MSARKAYISSLGTTGLLVAAALAMLIVVGALVAFDRWPNQAVAEAEAVQIADDGPHAIRAASAAKPRALAATGNGRRASRLSASRSATILRDAAARAGRVEQGSRAATRAAPSGRVADPIVSDLPAPDTAPDASAAPAPASAAGTPTAPDAAKAPAIQLPSPGSITSTAGDGLTDLTTGVGGTVGTLSPQLGDAVTGTGSATSQTLGALLGDG